MTPSASHLIGVHLKAEPLGHGTALHSASTAKPKAKPISINWRLR